jgi:hypothetical protein
MKKLKFAAHAGLRTEEPELSGTTFTDVNQFISIGIKLRTIVGD